MAFLFQVFVNVGMAIGIAPITGIPLPFVSVGGSSMITNLAAVGILRGDRRARRPAALHMSGSASARAGCSRRSAN